MELYVPRLLPSMPLHLFFLILTAAVFFPCSVCFDPQYEYCRHTGRTCGNMIFPYPFGVGNCGCGLPSFQIDCVQNSAPVITIHNRNYTILATSGHLNHVLILVTPRGENCDFLDHNNMQIQSSGNGNYTVFNIMGKEKQHLTLYKCDKQPDLGMQLWNCNATFYCALYAPGHPPKGCSMEKKVLVEVIKMEASINVRKRNESCRSCRASGGICGYNISNSTAASPFVCYCKNGPGTHECPGHGPRYKAILIIVCSIGGAALIAALSLAYYLKNRIKPAPSRSLPRHLPGREMGNLPLFSYEALRYSTNCFHKDNELGVGGFGSVYLGKLRDGRFVAVKRLYQDKYRRLEQFIHEVKIFSTLNHPHVVRLYGCTHADSPELLLVYEFVPNGTLAEHLHGDRKNPKGLQWNTRLNIAIQTAQALSFLHALDPPIFHRDVKSSNILLDENLDTKLADFGLCRLVPVDASHVTTIPQGTPGYVDPEYYQCYQLTDKSDVYSFGVVLVEIISAKIAMDINLNRKEINLASLAITKIQEGSLHQLVDPQLEIELNPEVKVMVSAVGELAFRCLASERDDRPHMAEIVAQLEEIRDSFGSSTGPVEQQLGSFSNIKQSNTAPLSPIFVQDKWPSISSTANISA